MKLQDAYVAEQAAMGSWTKIGYTMKQGDSFGYTDGAGFTETNQTVLIKDLGNKGTAGWIATSKVKLNDCVGGSTWTMSVYGASSSNSEGMVGYKTAVSAKVCSDLTPSFKKLASTSADATEGN